MTEKEAWLYLAQVWEGNVRYGPHCVEAVLFRDFAYGLCYTLDILEDNTLICRQVKTQMERKIPEHGIRFLFPTTLLGAKERVRFCLERAEELTKRL